MQNGYKNKNKNNINEKENNKEKSPRFFPPTLEEVKDYIASKGFSIDAQRFIDFYESKGWFVGKNKMKDWRAAVRTWQRKNEQEAPRTDIGVKYDSKQVKYDKKDLW